MRVGRGKGIEREGGEAIDILWARRGRGERVIVCDDLSSSPQPQVVRPREFQVSANRVRDSGVTTPRKELFIE